MKGWMLGGLVLAAGIAACSSKVTITPDTTGSTTGTGGTTVVMTTGTGASSPGGTSSSSGTGGSSVGGSPKVTTADNDMAQYEAINADLLSAQAVLQGPFFITDVFVNNAATLYTVSGSDCTAAQTVIYVWPNGLNQTHGVRTPILVGQSLCHGTGAGGTLTILGFRPY